MAVPKRFSIGTLMAVVFLVAADFGIVRAFWETPRPEVEVAIVTLPMIDLLMLSLPNLRRSDPTRPFWGGFHLVGWVTVLIFGLMAGCYPDSFFWPITFVDRMLAPSRPAAGAAIIISAAVVLYTTPQLLLALLAGRLSSKYRVVIERR